LNIYNQQKKEIANFFYLTAITPTTRYKNIFFFYFNKIALVHYPYLYQNYITAYFLYKISLHSSKKSQHIRFYLFIYIIKVIGDQINLLTPQSFERYTTNTITGYQKSIKNIFKNANRIYLQQNTFVEFLLYPKQHQQNTDALSSVCNYNYQLTKLILLITNKSKTSHTKLQQIRKLLETTFGFLGPLT
jgi:hypothetical protein